MRTPQDIQQKLNDLIAGWEGECVEFKRGGDGFSVGEIGQYFSALSNEANLRGCDSAWLVFGIDDRSREVVGTSYRNDPERLQSLKQQMANGTEPSTSFREIYDHQTAEGRVLLFEIPPAPRGIPIGWNSHYYARNGESLGGLSIAKLDEIRRQSIADDWSAVICADATLDDLLPEAMERAREVYARKISDRIPLDTIQSWDDRTFLDKAKLTIEGRITRTCLLLLGRPESTRHLIPYVAEMSWKLDGPEVAYEHFGPPFLLETSSLFKRIRNIRLTFLPPEQLIPVEVAKYDQRIILEALHNCIAHQDYTRQERILVTERPAELIFQSAGSFFDGKPDDYIRNERTPTKYRNRFLAEAMVNLRMIDTMGFGIRDIMWKGQAHRYLPLPDFDLSDSAHVVLRLQGRFLDENYSRTLFTHTNMSWHEVLALDAIQKGIAPDDSTVQSLRRQGVIEGRKPKYHITASIASAMGAETEYLHHKAFDDAYYCDLIIKYLKEFRSAKRVQFSRLLEDKFSDLLTPVQKHRKVHALLQKLQREGVIVVEGYGRAGVWRLVNDRGMITE